MFRVSTTNKAEAERTGKVYLDSKFYINIRALKPRKNRLCKNCGVVLRFEGNNTNNNKVDYCMECSPSNGYAMINRNYKKNEKENKNK